MRVEKSLGQTPTERYLATLCDRTFLRLWCYPNPFKAGGKELCDMLAVFEDHVFLFFDRESRRFDAVEKNVHLTWDRWKREAIDKQISTAAGAKNHVRRYRDRIFLDAKGTIPFPLTIPAGELHIHKIIVAHGAKEACLRFSKSNVSGSLGIAYGSAGDDLPLPFLVSLDKEDPVHLLDSHNLAIVLAELDTIHDFNAYLDAKEAAIRDLDSLAYCGEEDLLGHYFSNYNPATRAYFIGVPDGKYNGLFIGEGEWRSFVGTPRYRRRKRDNAISYLLDDLIQRTSQNALMGALIGNGNIFEGRSAIHQMAKEPRVSRRALSELIKRAIENFPADRSGIVRQVTRLPSFYEDKAYVFLQLWHPNITDYDGKYRPVRQHLLEVACGTAKNKFPALKQIIGIALTLAKFKMSLVEGPAAVEKRQQRQAIAAARAERAAQREEARQRQERELAKQAEIAAQAAADAARAAADEAAREAAEQVQRNALLEAEQKATRDARYAARKAAKKKRRRGY